VHVNYPFPFPGPGQRVPPPGRPAGGDIDEGIRARLFEQRAVLVSGFVDDGCASRVVAELMTLDAIGDAPIHLQLDSPGGTLDAAFSVMDTIDLCGVEVRVTCLGRAEGAAVGVLAVGHYRAATEHARIRLADPELRMEGHARDVAAQAAAAVERVAALHERIAAATRQPVARVAADCAAGRYLAADEARDYGLVDEVAGREATIRLLAGRRIGFRPPGR
jgi:ATP-dependent Clp protease protease subunit